MNIPDLPHLAPLTLPDCMIGPSEPCAGYLALQSVAAAHRRKVDEMYRLLLWADALMKSLTGYPERHPNEYVDWRDDMRRVVGRNVREE